ncbi:MAG TPA: hypothetical protein VIT43_13790 [Candidatus Dormibacteraeota bacterium]
MGGDRLWIRDSAWDPLAFHVYPAQPGTTTVEIVDDRRTLRLTLTVSSSDLVLDGGAFDCVAGVVVHRPGREPSEVSLGAKSRLCEEERCSSGSR